MFISKSNKQSLEREVKRLREELDDVKQSITMLEINFGYERALNFSRSPSLDRLVKWDKLLEYLGLEWVEKNKRICLWKKNKEQ